MLPGPLCQHRARALGGGVGSMTGGWGSPQHGSWQRGWALRFGESHLAAFQRVEAGASVDWVGRPFRTPQPLLLCWERWCLVCISFPCLCSAASVMGLRPIACPGPWCPSWEHVGVARSLSLWPWFALGSPLCAALSFKETEKHNSMRSHVHIRVCQLRQVLGS